MTDYKNLKLIATSSPRIRAAENTRSIMLDVIIAMMPALIWAIVKFGFRALLLTAVSAAGCVFFEWGYRKIMKKPQSVNDLSAVTQSACDGSDVIYIPTDNTAANNTETIANVVIPAGVPVVCGESGICSGCGVATLSISYEELGRITGEMAVQILTGEADVSELAIQYDTAVTKMYNAANCEALGITVPDGYQPIE